MTTTTTTTASKRPRPRSLPRHERRIILNPRSLLVLVWSITLFIACDDDNDDEILRVGVGVGVVTSFFIGRTYISKRKIISSASSSSHIFHIGRSRCRKSMGASSSSLFSSWSKFADVMDDDHPNSEEDGRNTSEGRRYQLFDTMVASGEGKDENFYDVSSARDWLEWCATNGAKSWPSGDPQFGSYTVIRCDLPLPRRSKSTSSPLKGSGDKYKTTAANFNGWKIWGLNFHLRRLQESSTAMMIDCDIEGFNSVADIDFSSAVESSYDVLELLLEDASTEILHRQEQEEMNDLLDRSNIITVMLTLLWQPTIRKMDDKIDTDQRMDDAPNLHVLGHAFSSTKAAPIQTNNPNNPSPLINVAIGRIPYNHDMHDDLPTRYLNHPEAKLSSWCTDRRPLEETFKSNQSEYNIGEVLLTRTFDDPATTTTKGRQQQSSVSLLEGLTSNLFVVYDDNVIRTPPVDESVLNGYARHLIVENAQQCGYTVEVKPILLDDVQSWKEVFVTSSIRLIIPVQTIFDVYEGEDGSLQLGKIWELNKDDTSSTPTELVTDGLYGCLMGTKY